MIRSLLIEAKDKIYSAVDECDTIADAEKHKKLRNEIMEIYIKLDRLIVKNL